jgi:hypothetical protein
MLRNGVTNYGRYADGYADLEDYGEFSTATDTSSTLGLLSSAPLNRYAHRTLHGKN